MTWILIASFDLCPEVIVFFHREDPFGILNAIPFGILTHFWLWSDLIMFRFWGITFILGTTSLNTRNSLDRTLWDGKRKPTLVDGTHFSMSCGRPIIAKCKGDRGFCGCGRRNRTRAEILQDIDKANELLDELRYELAETPDDSDSDSDSDHVQEDEDDGVIVTKNDEL
jgi:hypothetical protein